MKAWVLAALIPFVTGTAIGWATRKSTPAEISLKSTTEQTKSLNDPVVGLGGESQHSRPTVVPLLPNVLVGNGRDPLTPRQQALKALFDIIPRVQLQGAMTHAIWGDAGMERKALTWLRHHGIPKDRDLFVELEILGCITDPSVRAGLSEWIRSERDPVQKRRLASIIGGIFNSDQFLPLIEELLSDPDPQVTCAVLESFWLSMAWSSKQQDRKLRFAETMRTLAAPTRPKELRLRALRSLRGADDETSIRFLMQSALQDSNSDIVIAAIGSLPDGNDLSNALAVEMIRMLYAMATDEGRPLSVRASAANAADMNDMFDEYKVLTPAEQELIEKIRDSWSGE